MSTIGIKTGRISCTEPNKANTPKAETKTWYFTFGCGQRFEGQCQPIIGTYSDARAEMFMVHGKAWAFQYSAEQWQEIKDDPTRFWEMETEMIVMTAQVTADE